MKTILRLATYVMLGVAINIIFFIVGGFAFDLIFGPISDAYLIMFGMLICAPVLFLLGGWITGYLAKPYIIKGFIAFLLPLDYMSA